MRQINRLTAKAIAALKKPGLYNDGHNLYVQLQPNGSKSFLFRYMIDGKPRSIGFGRTDIVTLQDARAKAIAAKQLLLDAKDPRDVRDAEKAALKKTATPTPVNTFDKVAAEFIAQNEHTWGAKHLTQWRNTLARLIHGMAGIH
jgi:hypothetical protein